MQRTIGSGRSKCFTGKRIYVTEIEALQKLRRPNRPERGHYKCKHCGFWHLTSQDPATIGMTYKGD